jgi:hypothetical protein
MTSLESICIVIIIVLILVIARLVAMVEKGRSAIWVAEYKVDRVCYAQRMARADRRKMKKQVKTLEALVIQLKGDSL